MYVYLCDRLTKSFVQYLILTAYMPKERESILRKKSILAVAIASLVLAVNMAAFSATPKSDKGGCCPHEGSAAYKNSAKSSVHGKHAVSAKQAVKKSAKRAHSTSQVVKCCPKDTCKMSQCTNKGTCEKKNGKCAESCCAKMQKVKASSAGQMHGCPMDKKSNAAPAHGKSGGGCPVMHKSK